MRFCRKGVCTAFARNIIFVNNQISLRLKNLTWLLLALCFLAAPAAAQPTGDTMAVRADSALTEIQQLLQQSELQRIRDSVKAAVLNEELSKMVNPKRSEYQALALELADIRRQDSLRLVKQQQAVEALRQKTRGIPVLLFNDTLFMVYTALGPFSPVQRVRNTEEKVQALYESAFFNRDSLRIEAQQEFLNIKYGTEIITSISNTDALWEHTSRDSLAAQYKDRIGKAVYDYRESYSLRNTLIRIGYVAIVIVVVWLLIFLLNRLFLRLLRLIGRKKEALKGIKVKNYQLFSPDYVWNMIRHALLLLRLVCIVLVLYFAATVAFSIFPFTRSWTGTLMGWIWAPVRRIGLALFHYLPNLITIIVIVLVARFIARLFRFFSLEIERGILHIKGFHKDWAKPTYNIVRFFVYAFAFVVIFPYLPGSDSIAFKGVSVFLGILFSIGSSSAIANTVAGFVITYMRPFKLGDWIRVNDITGYVVEKTALITRIRTLHNEDITIPNSSILANHTINYSSASKDPGLLIHTTISIGYDTPWPEVHRLLIEAARTTKGIDSGKEPFVLQTSLDDFYISYEINAYTHLPEQMFFIQSDLMSRIQDVFHDAGVQIMSPQQINIQEHNKSGQA
ncbi:mechanosensitive ion channel-like protein [Taibaiella chishuiensis]|uniref:Mechanosensitive ion channel-like protein n=1 Tax=Taibaiella chishuiensis TaxID=1434707 RepID=A0A2P8CY12_9BACT|nr:mechanosensitive ion channel-like protein [Taibaiella chishuiensis]